MKIYLALVFVLFPSCTTIPSQPSRPESSNSSQALSLPIPFLELPGSGRSPSSKSSNTTDDPLGKNWVDGGKEIKPEHLQRLLELLHTETYAWNIVTKSMIHADIIHERLEAEPALKNMKLSKESLTFITPCGEGWADGVTTGPVTWTLYLWRDISEILDTPSKTPDREIVKLYAPKTGKFKEANQVPNNTPERYEVEPDAIYYRVLTQRPAICMDQDLSIKAAAEVLLHEMVHYMNGYKLYHLDWGQKLSRFKDRNDYAAQTVRVPGGERDAYIAQFTWNLRKWGPKSMPYDLSEMFIDYNETNYKEAKFENHKNERPEAEEKMVNFILDTLGYRTKRFSGEFAQALQSSIQIQNYVNQQISDQIKFRELEEEYYREKAKYFRSINRPADAERHEKLHAAALESKKRLTQSMQYHLEVLEKSKAMLKTQ